MNKVGSVNVLKSGLKKGIGFFGFSDEVADKSSQVTYTILSGLAIAPALKDPIGTYKSTKDLISKLNPKNYEKINYTDIKNITYGIAEYHQERVTSPIVAIKSMTDLTGNYFTVTDLKGDIIDSYKKIENDIKEKFKNLKEFLNIGELKNLKVNSIMIS